MDCIHIHIGDVAGFLVSLCACIRLWGVGW